MKCPKCEKEISEVEFYKYHWKCKDCWNEYCKTHRYYNKDVQKKAKEKWLLNNPDYKPVKDTSHVCKKCGIKKPQSEFLFRNQTCKKCKGIKTVDRKPAHTNANQRKSTQKVIIEFPERYGKDKYINEINKFQKTKKAIIKNPDRIIKVEKTVYQKIRVNDYGRPNKIVRKGWDEIMAQIKLKIELTQIEA